MLSRKVMCAGRTLWLGGTEVSRKVEATQFNCSFLQVRTVFDVVDAYWLLLQGCGVGFEPIQGTLSGFSRPVQIEVVHSTRTDKGNPHNKDFHSLDGTWHLVVGDSAQAWAKAVGKLLAYKGGASRIVLDFTNIRPAGQRLSQYGWISQGDELIAKAFTEIAHILNRRAGQLLTRIDILDILNWIGTTLSSRRSAEIALVPYGDPESEAFALAKKDHFPLNPQRAQSNNSLVFYQKPSRLELRGIFHMMLEAGGSEPGFINGQEALRRAPWFKGVNPCAEILLGDKSFCNLFEVNVSAFCDELQLKLAVYLAARANYRQTCVDLRDGVLSNSWHELNQFLRLCGVGLTGLVSWLDTRDPTQAIKDLHFLRGMARCGADSMADELGLPKAKAVTTIKPSGTLSKIMDTTEGCHRPIGKYVFNNLNFSKYDPLVPMLEEAGYRVQPNPYDDSAVIAAVPVSYEGVKFDEKNGLEVNLEPAVNQLGRYKLLMDHYVDHNCSITVSYDPSEVSEIVDWLDQNWDSYVGVSFMLRADPTKTAEELGYPYLPQEVVTKEVYDEYVSRLKPIDLDKDTGDEMVSGDECAGGVCPIR